MSNTINTILIEEAYELIEFVTGTGRDKEMLAAIERNDLDGLRGLMKDTYQQLEIQEATLNV